MFDCLYVPYGAVRKDDAIYLIAIGGIAFKVMLDGQYILTILYGDEQLVVQPCQANIVWRNVCEKLNNILRTSGTIEVIDHVLTIATTEYIGIRTFAPNQIVIACSAIQSIIANTTFQPVITFSTAQLIVTLIANQCVIAYTAIDNIIRGIAVQRV
ncbi:hypothetical protein D9M69_304530 [compost metagenome]